MNVRRRKLEKNNSTLKTNHVESAQKKYFKVVHLFYAVGIIFIFALGVYVGSKNYNVDEKLVVYRNRWRYDNGESCSQSEVYVDLKKDEVEKKKLSKETIDHVVDVIRRCGVVAVRNAIPKQHLKALKIKLDMILNPLLHSRASVRNTLRKVFLKREFLKNVREGTPF